MNKWDSVHNKRLVYSYEILIHCWVNALSAVDKVYGWNVKAMFFLGSNTINPILSI